MVSNNLVFTTSRWSTKLHTFCYSLALWGGVIFLCLIALLCIQLSISSGTREKLYQFLTHYPYLIGVSALLPLMAAGALMTYLVRHRHACYTFHSSLLTFDVDPTVIASTIETAWNIENRELPITCQVTSKGNAIRVFIKALAPPKEIEQETAEKLHASAMKQLHALLVATHPIAFHIQWN